MKFNKLNELARINNDTYQVKTDDWLTFYGKISSDLEKAGYETNDLEEASMTANDAEIEVMTRAYSVGKKELYPHFNDAQVYMEDASKLLNNLKLIVSLFGEKPDTAFIGRYSDIKASLEILQQQLESNLNFIGSELTLGKADCLKLLTDCE